MDKSVFVLVLLVILSPVVAGAGWWGADWEYRQEVIISPPEGEELIDYPVIIPEFDCGNRCKEDYRDIRVVRGEDQVPYSVREGDSGADIVFRLNGSGDSSTYIYYGNDDAVSNSSDWRDVRYLIHDNFDDATRSNRWDTDRTESWREYGGILRYREDDGRKSWIRWSRPVHLPVNVSYVARQRGGHNPSADAGILFDNTSIRIAPRSIEGFTLLNSTGHRVEQGEVAESWRRITWIVTSEPGQQLFVDGEPVAQIEDSGLEDTGVFGLYGNSGRWSRFSDYTIAYDNVSVAGYIESDVSLDIKEPERYAGETVSNIVVADREYPDLFNELSDEGTMFLVVSGNSTVVQDEIRSSISDRDVLSNIPLVAERVSITLIGVPPIVKSDPVENGWGASDPGDADRYLTDLPYGDLDGDGIVDVAVGRLPADPELAMAMLNRSDRRGKDAFVASAYLRETWPGILASRGGGMWGGKLLGTALARQGYTVERAVEHRADTQEFLAQLSPHGLSEVMRDTKTVQGVASSVAGKTAGNAAAALFATVKSLRYAERALEQYLEYDWGTAGFDPERAQERAAETGNRPVDIIRRTVAAAGVAGVPSVLRSAGFAAAASDLVYTYLWPDRYPRLTADAVQEGLADADAVYYLGAGNGSAWTLPSGAVVAARDVPETDARLVFDASSTAARNRSQLWRAFLERGAGAYVGSSAVTYAPFTTEIAHRFATQGHTVGEALRKAVNGMATDSLAWPDPETLIHRGVRGKMLRSFILWGDPTARKDPIAPPDRWETRRDCTGTRCTITFAVEPDYDVVERNGTRRVEMPADGRVLRAGKPQIPLFKKRYGLPADANILGTDVDAETRQVADATVPVTRIAPHGGTAPEPPVLDESFPENLSRVTVQETFDNRTVLDIAHAGLRTRPDGSVKVVERVVVTARYRTPLEMELAVENASADAVTLRVTAWSDQERNATLVMRLANATAYRASREQVRFPRGKSVHDVRLRVPDPGTWSITGTLVAGDDVVGPRTVRFTVHRERPILQGVEAPDAVDEGDRFRVRARLANPGSAARNVTLEIGRSGGVQPAFREPRSRVVRVPADATVREGFVMLAYDDGPATVTVDAGDRRRTRRLQVTDASLATRTGPGSDRIRLEHGTVTVRPGGATWQTPEGTLTLRASPAERRAVLDDGTKQIAIVARPNGTRLVVAGLAGTTLRTTHGGATRMTRTGTRPPATLAPHETRLERAVHRLQRIITAREDVDSISMAVPERYRLAP